MYDKFFSVGTLSVNKPSSPSDNSQQENIHPTVNAQSTIEPITPTINFNAKENNNDQATDAQIGENEFYNIFSTPVLEEAESSSLNVDNSNMHTFYQRHLLKTKIRIFQ
nr:hypothetical protein [Tanacetum cinerariifolium]